MQRIKRYIGLDLGAESSRCVVGELHQGRLKQTEVYRFATPSMNCAGHFFWDILAIYAELEKSLLLAKNKFGSQFDGISLDAWGVDYVLLDDDNRILGYPYHYRDCRTDGVMKKAFQLVSREKIYEYTGSQFAQYNTLFQLLSEKEQKLNLLSIANQLLPISSFLLYLLSGAKNAEYTIVSTTQLSDPQRRNWSDELIKEIGLPRKIFPTVVKPGTYLGKLLPELAKKTGVSEETPVIAGASHDTAAAVASIPATDGNWAFMSSGTWSLMGVELEEPLINSEAMAHNFSNEGGVSGTTRFLTNINGLWPLQECRRYWLENGYAYKYVELVRLALEESPTKSWIDPDDKRFLQPGGMPSKIISFLKETNQTYHDEICWITRCILESLAFKYRIVFKELEKLTVQSLGRLHVVGGGIQNELLCQMTANAINRQVIAGPVEATVVGNIGMQAIAMGDLTDIKAFRKVVANSFDLKTYEPKETVYWDENEVVFRSLLCRKNND